MPDLYEDVARWQPEKFLENPAILKRFALAAQLIPEPSQTLLDVGTGNGAFLRYVEDQPGPQYLTGLEHAHAAMASAVCQTAIIPGDIERLPFADQSFSIVTALEVIEHLPYRVYEQGLAELERVARDHIIISVPYLEIWRQVRCPYCGCCFHKNYHLRRYDEAIVRNLFSAFRCEKTVRVDIPEYAIMPLVRAARQLYDPYLPFPSDTICPQCGYSRSQDRVDPSSKSKSDVATKVTRLIPLRKRTRWIIGLYRRTDSATGR